MKTRLLTATLFSALLAMPAYAEEDAAPPSMADMHALQSMSASMPGPAHAGGDCDSVHGMGHGHGMMGSKGDDCDTKHGMSRHMSNRIMGLEDDDCDSKHGSMSEHHGYDAPAGGGHGYGMGGHAGGGSPYGGMMGGTMMLMQLDTHLLDGLDLSKSQQDKVTKIADQLKHDNWITQGQINDETAKLRDLYQAEHRSPSAIGREYGKVFDLKRRMIETYLDAENNVEDVLNPDQLEMMKGAREAMRHMYGM